MDALQAALAAALEIKRASEMLLMGKTNVVATGVGFKIAGDTVTNKPRWSCRSSRNCRSPS